MGFEYGVGGSHESYKVRTEANPKWCTAVSCHCKSCTAWHSVRFDAIAITRRVTADGKPFRVNALHCAALRCAALHGTACDNMWTGPTAMRRHNGANPSAVQRSCALQYT